MKHLHVSIAACLLAGVTHAAPIEPAWKSPAENYQVPDWLMDDTLGVWMHRGFRPLQIPIARTTGRGMAEMCKVEGRSSTASAFRQNRIAPS